MIGPTPGPWWQEDGRIYGEEPSAEGSVLICSVTPDGDALTEFDVHNARLIAAAPELLEALRTTLDCLTSWMETAAKGDERDYDYEAVEAAQAAIKKAIEGEPS